MEQRKKTKAEPDKEQKSNFAIEDLRKIPTQFFDEVMSKIDVTKYQNKEEAAFEIVKVVCSKMSIKLKKSDLEVLTDFLLTDPIYYEKFNLIFNKE